MKNKITIEDILPKLDLQLIADLANWLLETKEQVESEGESFEMLLSESEPKDWGMPNDLFNQIGTWSLGYIADFADDAASGDRDLILSLCIQCYCISAEIF